MCELLEKTWFEATMFGVGNKLEHRKFDWVIRGSVYLFDHCARFPINDWFVGIK